MIPVFTASYLSQAELVRLVKFVFGESNNLKIFKNVRYLYVEDGNGPDPDGMYRCGKTQYIGEFLVKRGSIIPMCDVFVHLHKYKNWPHVDQMSPRTPKVILQDYAEKMVITLGHELRHVHQFAEDRVIVDGRLVGPKLLEDLEVEAECAGVACLDAYRHGHRLKAA